MKKLFLFFLIAGTTLWSCQVQSQNLERVGVDQFEKILKENKEVQLVDVRTPEEYQMGHLEGSKLINFRDKDFKQQLQTLDRTKPVMVYCAVGGRSRRASEMLDEMGFNEIYDLDGGINAWQASGKDVSKE